MTKPGTPCPMIFRSSECGYKGDQLQCDKTFLNCGKFDNHTRYGGEPRDAYSHGVSVPLGMIDTLLKGIEMAGKNNPEELKFTEGEMKLAVELARKDERKRITEAYTDPTEELTMEEFLAVSLQAKLLYLLQKTQQRGSI